MSETSRRIFGLAEFLVGETGPDRRFELMGGEAVMMVDITTIPLSLT